MPGLELIFMGSAAFAVPILNALLGAGHRVAAVYTRPPRPAGRRRRPLPTPVHDVAAALGLTVRTPATLKDAEAMAAFAGLGADAAVVAAYGLILPPPMLRAPRLGCLNVHASLLPRWRGAAPIERALLAGDAETGVTIMRMDEGLDTGPILLAEAVPIPPAATAESLRESLSVLGARLILRALDGVARGTLAPVAQDSSRATFAPKLEPAEGRIPWSRPAAEIERRVRALNPAPGTWFEHAGVRIRVLAAEVAPGGSEGTRPGQVLDDRLAVACGDGRLRPVRVQRAGRSAQDADAFLRGYRIPPGTVLD